MTKKFKNIILIVKAVIYINILLTIAYDGTNYHGWQRQPNSSTVQAAVEKAVSKLFSQEISLITAGRTDTGVHALAHRASMKIETNIPMHQLPSAINYYLPDDIVITKAESVSDEFHPRYNALCKTYRYTIQNSRYPTPTLRNYSAFVPQKLDVEKMREQSKYFIGEHDFIAFSSRGSIVKTTVRIIYSFEISQQDDIITFTVTGNGFLYNMVRKMAGTLIEIGKGKNKNVSEIILSRDRSKVGKTAAASGLTLVEIFY